MFTRITYDYQNSLIKLLGPVNKHIQLLFFVINKYIFFDVCIIYSDYFYILY